jgi:hypothetical protein
MTEQKKAFDDLEAVKLVVTALEKFDDDERKRIIKWSCERLNMDYSINENKKIFPESVNSPEILTEKRIERVGDIKSFITAKNPKNDSQFAAAVAYYYKFESPESERLDSISSKDLVEATRVASWNRLKKPAGTLHNAYSHAGLLDKSEHGRYKLNSVGENLVAMVLPDNNTDNITKKTKKRKINKNIPVKKPAKGKKK